jgi:hypothetical protein
MLALYGPLNYWKLEKFIMPGRLHKMSSIWASYLKPFGNGGQLKSQKMQRFWFSNCCNFQTDDPKKVLVCCILFVWSSYFKSSQIFQNSLTVNFASSITFKLSPFYYKTGCLHFLSMFGDVLRRSVTFGNIRQHLATFWNEQCKEQG